MPNPPNQQSPEQEKTHEAGTEQEERRETNPNEPLEGAPGYGQPPEEVRRHKLPDQKW
jgi:hypothetical protein